MQRCAKVMHAKGTAASSGRVGQKGQVTFGSGLASRSLELQELRGGHAKTEVGIAEGVDRILVGGMPVFSGQVRGHSRRRSHPLW